MSGPVRVLPLGGLGEIGKNMTVVEQDGHIIVIDVGLRFPTQEQHGVDLVLPDFTYLVDRAEQIDAIEAIVITHGHEDHLGSLPWVIRDLGQDKIPVVYGGQLTIAMARSKLDEHKLRDVRLEVLPIGDTVDAGPFEIERIHLTHSIPDSSGIALTTALGTVLFTGDYKFDQTPVGGAPADMSSDSDSEIPGRSTFVESPHRSSRPFRPSSARRDMSAGAPPTGVWSNL